MSVNKAIVSGRFAADPIITETAKTKIAKFTIACRRNYKNADGDYEVDWIDCTAFGGTADFIEKFFTKGTGAIVCGRNTVDSYTNKDGEKVRSKFITVEEISFGEGGGREEEGATTSKRKAKASPTGNSGLVAPPTPYPKGRNVPDFRRHENADVDDGLEIDIPDDDALPF